MAAEQLTTSAHHQFTWLRDIQCFLHVLFFCEGIFALCFLLPLSPEPYILKSKRSDEEPNEKTRTGCATQRTLRTTSTSSLFCYVCFSAGRYRTVLVFSFGHVAKKCFGVSWNECRMCSEHGRRTNETRKSRRYYAFCWDTSAESTLVTSRSHPLSKISLRPSW